MADAQIQWYPGHMTKTRRQIEADIKQVDAVCEIIDARIPRASRNPDIDALCASKPRLIVMNRIDMADPSESAKWKAHFEKECYRVLQTDSKNKKGFQAFSSVVEQLLADKIALWKEKGQTGRIPKLMIVGIPNVGKSTFINQISGRKNAKAENRPGVTKGKQWIHVSGNVMLMDTPGILWPKFEDERVGKLLAVTGAIRDQILDTETLSCELLQLLRVRYPQMLCERYGITVDSNLPAYDLLEQIGAKRGFLLRGGIVNTERTASVLLEEFRNLKIGRMTLEGPDEADGNN